MVIDGEVQLCGDAGVEIEAKVIEHFLASVPHLLEVSKGNQLSM